MLVNSYNMEFGYELLSAVPHAYELHKAGLLTETVSGPDTAALYYFSPKHTINTSERSWYNTEKARLGGLPHTSIHTPWPSPRVFPPYAQVYSNNEFVYDKPILCICNRYNIEWGVKPINFFDLKILSWLFDNLKAKYQVVYFPVSIPKEFYDGVKPIALNDIALAKQHGITVFTDLIPANGSWNETMLKVFANCKHYVTMNGGYSILASMFQGTNIIYSKPGLIETKEIKNKSFWRWYPNINDVRTLHVPSYDGLKAKVQALYIDEQPCINILVRTHRPNYLKICMRSIQRQTYKNINVVLICDSMQAVKYTQDYNARVVAVSKSPIIDDRPAGEEYGKRFPYNSYLAQVQEHVDGYIMFLDDDDQFTKHTAVESIVEYLKPDHLTIWRSDLKLNGIIPSHSFGKSIELFDITGIAICYHSKNKQFTDWSNYKRADYRTAKSLSKVLPITWIDQVLTSIQDKPGYGLKQDIPAILKIVIANSDSSQDIELCIEEAEFESLQNYYSRLGKQIKIIN